MRMIWKKLIGRYYYRIDVGQSGRWMLVREKSDDEDDEIVTRGSRIDATLALIKEDIIEELLALAEEVQSD